MTQAHSSTCQYHIISDRFFGNSIGVMGSKINISSMVHFDGCDRVDSFFQLRMLGLARMTKRWGLFYGLLGTTWH